MVQASFYGSILIYLRTNIQYDNMWDKCVCFSIVGPKSKSQMQFQEKLVMALSHFICEMIMITFHTNVNYDIILLALYVPVQGHNCVWQGHLSFLAIVHFFNIIIFILRQTTAAEYYVFALAVRVSVRPAFARSYPHFVSAYAFEPRMAHLGLVMGKYYFFRQSYGTCQCTKTNFDLFSSTL